MKKEKTSFLKNEKKNNNPKNIKKNIKRQKKDLLI